MTSWAPRSPIPVNETLLDYLEQNKRLEFIKQWRRGRQPAAAGTRAPSRQRSTRVGRPAAPARRHARPAAPRTPNTGFPHAVIAQKMAVPAARPAGPRTPNTGFPHAVIAQKMAVPPRGVVVLITALAIYVPLSFIIIQSFLSAPSSRRPRSSAWTRSASSSRIPISTRRSRAASSWPSAWPPSPFRWEACWLPDDPHRPAGPTLDRAADPGADLRVAHGAGLRWPAGPVGFSTWAQSLLPLERLFAHQHRHHRRPDPRRTPTCTSRRRCAAWARTSRKPPACPAPRLRVMVSVSLPMVRPAMLYATVLLFFLGLEVFGLVLVLGDPEGNLVLATYLYKLTNKLGIPSYHLMAAVAVVLICMTIPLVMLQRRLMRTANRFVTVKGKASRARRCRWASGAGWPARSSRSGCWSPSWCRCWACCCAPSYRTGAWACRCWTCCRWMHSARCSRSPT